MKKILLALFLITDLYSLPPNESLKLKNPTEELKKQAFSPVKQNVSDWEKYDNCPAKTKENDTLLQICTEIPQQGLKYLIEEIDLISRNPDNNERENIEKFAKALNISSDNLEIRIIDPQSYISGIYLPQERRDFFLSWLNADSENGKQFLKEDNELFEDLISKIDFPNKFLIKDLSIKSGKLATIKSKSEQNELFRNKILNMMIDSSEKSKIFRKLMICFFAYTEATQSIGSTQAYGSIKNSILEGTSSCRCREGVVLSEQQLEKGLYRTYFKSNQTIGPFPQGFYGVFASLSQTFFHECGHALDFFSPAFDFYKINKTLENISKFFDISIDKEQLKNQRIKQKKELEKNPRVLSTAKALTGISFKSIDEFIKYEEGKLQNPIVQSKLLMGSSAEIWQIFGVSLLEHNSKRKLYINYMSDIALYLEQKLPLRMSHKATKLPISETTLTKSAIVHYELPIEVYGTLLQVYRTNLSAYLLQLQFPRGLSALLQNEYRLLPKEIKRLKNKEI